MNFYWLIPFIAILILATCNGAIITSEKKDRVKYSLLLFNSTLVLWASLDVILWVNKIGDEPGAILEKLKSVSWLSIGFIYLNFVYELLHRKRNVFYYIILAISVLIVLISISTNKIVAGIEVYYWGAFPMFGDWILPVVAITIIPMFYGIMMIARALKKEKNANLKTIYKVIIIGSVITIIIDSTVDVIMPQVFHFRIISMATLGNSLLSAMFLYIITKHRFLEISMEEFSKKIFDSVQEGVIITSEDGEIVMINNSATALLEKNKNDIRKIIDMSDDGNALIKSKVKDIKTGESTYLNVSNNNIISSDGRKLNLFLLNDVSELVKYRNSLIDRNEEMQITLYRIGHDIKAPASSIKQLVLFSKTDKENAEIYLEKIDLSIHQLIFFIQEVETLIRAKESDLREEKIDLDKIVQRCWSELAFFMEGKNHQLKIDINCTKEIYSDSTLLYSVLLNIISNAIKYHDIANKGENLISIKASYVTDKLHIEISDNGIGMNEATVKGVYNLFYRGSTLVSGTGLGMNIAKKAIERLNGTVKISSEPGKGTTFYLDIPVKEKI